MKPTKILQSLIYNGVSKFIFSRKIFLIYDKGDVIVDLYEKLPADLLLAFYDEILKNINKGLLSKTMYYELGLIISVASQRGITLGRPWDFEQVVDPKHLDDFIQLAYRCDELIDTSYPSS